jgi:oxygen-independent coproporphyrinogen-3 oxidase
MPLSYLTEKYNTPVPRYTSYPTMPYWDTANFTVSNWEDNIQKAFTDANNAGGISLYIHLPFCEDLCTYCGCNTRITKNHGVEVPYIAAVLKEWEMYEVMFSAKPIIREVHLGGGTPTFFSPKNLEALINGIFEKATVHKDAEFSFEAHPANTTIEHLTTLYKLGFRRLSLGIQDFDPEVQKIINRKQTFEQVLHVTANARKIGYTSINYDLIYGLPHQTMDSLISTMNIVAGLEPDRIAFYSYAHVPWVKPGQRLFTEQDLPQPQLKNKLHEIGRSLLKGYGYQEIGMDHFAMPGDDLLLAQANGTMHRNFMGYTHQRTQLLVGLGVSSISDAGYAFAQNVKTVEEYLKLINAKQLPVFKGHVLTSEDLTIRKHVLEIMCTGKTMWNQQILPSLAIFNGIERLQPLADDGLVEIDPWGLKVTASGNAFLRNICMALDARLWQDQPNTQLFSMAV